MSPLDRMDFEGDRINIGSETITVGELIASGNEGEVYHIEDSSGSVVKIFKEGLRERKEDKIQAMIDRDPDDPTYEKKGFRSIIWPQEIATSENSGSFLGYKMPYVDRQSTVTSFQYADDTNYLAGEDTDSPERFRTARNLAIMVHNIHAQGHAIGDFNDENILIDDGYIALIDCDSFHIRGEDDTYPGDTWHPRYSPPQQLGNSIAGVQKGDKFCLGVHIFQFLFDGLHPYKPSKDSDDAVSGNLHEMISNNPFPYQDTEQDIDPPSNCQERFDQLPQEIRKLFINCFGHGSKDVTFGRPEPIEWVRALRDTTGESSSNVSVPSYSSGDGSDRGSRSEGDRSEGDAKVDTGPGDTNPPTFGTRDDNIEDSGGTDSIVNDATNTGPGVTTVPNFDSSKSNGGSTEETGSDEQTDSSELGDAPGDTSVPTFGSNNDGEDTKESG